MLTAIIQEKEGGGYTGYILEAPDIEAEGATLHQTKQNLENLSHDLDPIPDEIIQQRRADFREQYPANLPAGMTIAIIY